MIVYDSGDYHLAFLCRLQGSSFPRAALFSLPSAGLAVLFSYLLDQEDGFEFLTHLNQSSVWSASIVVLGILVAFRTNKAYDRFWEGITLVQQMRAEWFEAASNLMAFSEVAAKKNPANEQMVNDVSDFQLTLIRLMSLMHGAALRQIGGYKEEFPVLDLQGLDEDSLGYLADCEEILSNRVEVLLHWIQVLITDSHTVGIVDVAPPILTRAYQTLSRGMVNLHNARKLADVPFPFPLSQTVVTLIVVQSLLTPIFSATLVKHAVLSAIIAFLPIFGMWSIIFIAGQLEQPFGTDPNDLPLSVLQFDMNTSLLMLLEAKTAPSLTKRALRTVPDLRLSLGNTQGSRTDAVDLRRGMTGHVHLEDRIENSTCLDSFTKVRLDSKSEGDFGESGEPMKIQIGKSSVADGQAEAVASQVAGAPQIILQLEASSAEMSPTTAEPSGNSQAQAVKPLMMTKKSATASLNSAALRPTVSSKQHTFARWRHTFTDGISFFIPFRHKAHRPKSHQDQLKQRQTRLTQAQKPRDTNAASGAAYRASFIGQSYSRGSTNSHTSYQHDLSGLARRAPAKDFRSSSREGSPARDAVYDEVEFPKLHRSHDSGTALLSGESGLPRPFSGSEKDESTFPFLAPASHSAPPPPRQHSGDSENPVQEAHVSEHHARQVRSSQSRERAHVSFSPTLLSTSVEP